MTKIARVRLLPSALLFCAAFSCASLPLQDAAAKEADAPSAEAAALVEKAERLAPSADPADAFKAYQKAALAFDDVDFHRRIARAWFDRAERLKAELRPQLEEASMTWYSARDAAYEERRSIVMGKFKRFNPNNPNYVAATKKYGDLLERARVALDLLANAQLAFTAVLRHTKHKDFEAAACQPLCLLDNGETLTRVRARQLLVSFLAQHKPANARERALYDRCKEELEKMDNK